MVEAKKRDGFFGKVRYGTSLICGYDAGYDDRDTCGAPAIWHGWPGTSSEDRVDGVVSACEGHFKVLTGKLWDFHPTGGACGIPGAQWYSGTEQGQGCCKHDLDFDTLHVSLAEPAQSSHVEPMTTHRNQTVTKLSTFTVLKLHISC